MLLVREVFHCRPGKVRPLLEKFQAMGKLMQSAGQPPMRLMTDLAGARYWTLVAEMEVESLAAFEASMLFLVLLEPVPASTGTRPLANRTVRAISSRCSASVKVGDSPVVPQGTKPLMPPSICLARRAS